MSGSNQVKLTTGATLVLSGRSFFMTRLEHANVTVPDIDAAIRFLQIVAPDFIVRHDETPAGSYRWAHIGNDDFYIALQHPHLDADPQSAHTTYRNFGLNHLGLVVDELDSIIATLDEAGYRQGKAVPDAPARRRAYYFDNAGFEWELVQYLSDIPAEKNHYE